MTPQLLNLAMSSRLPSRLALLLLLATSLSFSAQAAPAEQGETAILDDIHATVPPIPSPMVASNTTPEVPIPGVASPTLQANPTAPTNDTAPMLTSVSPGTVAAGALPTTAPTTPSQNVTVNLINLMVKRGLISKGDAADLIKQAQDEAAAATEQAQATLAQVAAASATTSVGTPAQAVEANENDSVSVTYIPDSVKTQIADQVTQDVLAKGKKEGWVEPRKYPTWASRFTFFGDTRVRFQADTYPSGNANNGSFGNFNAVNTGPPVNLFAPNTLPYYNVDQDRNRFRLRARFGFDVNLEQGFSGGMRIATGSDNSPVTTNQTFGQTYNGQGGDFSKYAIWLDRAFIKYQYGPDQDHSITAIIGRFDNPFINTSMVFDDDVGFDGFAIKGRYTAMDGLVPFATLGAFPVFNTDFNFSSTQPAKFGNDNKWLYAGQVGANWKITKDFEFTGALAIYDYETVQGKLSNPFTPLLPTDSGNTDSSRPSFAQNGNTYFPIRDNVIIDLNPQGAYTPSPDYQYFGLASSFREFSVLGQLDVNHFDPFHIRLTSEFIQNLAYDKSAINNVAINTLNSNGNYAGGGSAFMSTLILGAPVLAKRWDWNVNVGYRYVESDALVDGFADSDFGGALAGTNLQGFTLGGGVALSSHIWVNLNWMSSNAIAGPTYKSDVFQVDLNSKF